jgi:hypothetical protein
MGSGPFLRRRKIMLSSIAPFQHGLLGRLADAAGSDGERSHQALRRSADGCHGRQRACEPGTTAAPASQTPTAVAPATAFHAAAQDLVGRALDSLGRDLGKLLQGLGALAETIQGLVESALQPVRDALAQGLDFTAEIRLAAVRQQTLVTENGVAQDLQLLARSLTIEVNHSTGAIAIDLQSLSVEQSSLAVFSGQAAQPSIPGGGAIDQGLDHGLGEFVERLLREARGDQGAADEARSAQAGFARPLLIDALQDSLADDTRNGNEQQSRGRFALRGVEHFKNDGGQLVTRLRLDVAIQIATQLDVQRLLESLPPAQRSNGLDLSA